MIGIYEFLTRHLPMIAVAILTLTIILVLGVIVVHVLRSKCIIFHDNGWEGLHAIHPHAVALPGEVSVYLQGESKLVTSRGYRYERCCRNCGRRQYWRNDLRCWFNVPRYGNH